MVTVNANADFVCQGWIKSIGPYEIRVYEQVSQQPHLDTHTEYMIWSPYRPRPLFMWYGTTNNALYDAAFSTFLTQQDVDAFLAFSGKTSANGNAVQYNDDNFNNTTYVKPLNQRNKI